MSQQSYYCMQEKQLHTLRQEMGIWILASPLAYLFIGLPVAEPMAHTIPCLREALGLGSGEGRLAGSGEGRLAGCDRKKHRVCEAQRDP